MTEETNGSLPEAQDTTATITQEPAAPQPTPDAAPEPAPEPKAEWPADWRVQMAGGDDKTLKRLERFASPLDVWKHTRALETKQGELKKPLPENPTPEQLTEWRKDNGIPDTPEGYEEALQGIVIGEEDKPLVGEFLKDMHLANANPEHVNAAVAAYYKITEKAQAQQIEADNTRWAETEQALKEEWGPDYSRNRNLLLGMLEPSGMKDDILSARMPDGTKLGASPEALRFLANLAREVNPVATVVSNPGSNSINAIADEISMWEGKMGDRSSDYWKGANADKNQQRYRELISARDKMAAKS